MDIQSNPLHGRPKIVCVIGGPGSGKGTQCEKLVRDYKYKQLSVGQLMRDEVEKKTKEGQEIAQYQNEGKLVPTSMTIPILLKAIKTGNSDRYLLDGFPRNLEQALFYENQFREIDLIINYNVSDEELTNRILSRAAADPAHARSDDNPEAIKKRLAVYHEATNEAIEFYRQFGKVREIDAHQTPDQIYVETQKALIPNMIMFYGPPASGQDKVAGLLQKLTEYTILDVHELFKKKKVSNASDEIKVETLIAFLQSANELNYIVNNFPDNAKQARIFTEYYAHPRLLYYFDSSKDQVEANIKNRDKKEKKVIMEKYESYIKSRKDILKHFSNRDYFRTVRCTSSENPEVMLKQIETDLLPDLIACPQIPDNDFSWDYLKRIQAERGYHYIDVNSLTKNEIDRGTEIGTELKFCTPEQYFNLQIRLLKRTIFMNPIHRKFLLAGFPDKMDQYHEIENQLCPISFGLAFTKEGPLELEGENLLSYFNSQGRLIKVDDDFIDIFDSYLVKKGKWGFLFGPIAENNAKVVQYLQGKYVTRLINWTQLEEDLKVKLTTEDGEPDEITFEQYCDYFKNEFANLKPQENVLFDGWTHEKEEFVLADFIKSVGNPSYVMYLKNSKDAQRKKYRDENDVPADEELPADAEEEIDNKFQVSEDQLAIFENAIKEGASTKIITVDGLLPQPDLIKNLNNLIYKRVLAFRTKENQKEIDYKNTLMNSCLAHNVTFVDVEYLIRKHMNSNSEYGKQLNMQYAMRQVEERKYYPSNYTPDLVIEIIKEYLFSHPSYRYVLLYGYPSAEQAVEENEYYPRPMDEFHIIQTTLGPVRQIMTTVSQPEEYFIDDEVVPREEPVEEKKEEKKDGDEEGDDAPPEDNQGGDDDEEGKKKFDPTQFEWTNSDGRPKLLTQVYHKIGCEGSTVEIHQNNLNELNTLIKSSVDKFEAGDEGNYYIEILN